MDAAPILAPEPHCPAGLTLLQCAITPHYPPICWTLEQLGINPGRDAIILKARNALTHAAVRSDDCPVDHSPDRVDDHLGRTCAEAMAIETRRPKSRHYELAEPRGGDELTGTETKVGKSALTSGAMPCAPYFAAVRAVEDLQESDSLQRWGNIRVLTFPSPDPVRRYSLHNGAMVYNQSQPDWRRRNDGPQPSLASRNQLPRMRFPLDA